MYGSLAAHARQKAIAFVKRVGNSAVNKRWCVAVAVEAQQHNAEEDPVARHFEALARALSWVPIFP